MEIGGRVFRVLRNPTAPFPQTWSDSGPLSGLVADGRLWPGRPLARDRVPDELLQLAAGATGFLEHPRLSPISYPFEWPFALLQRAALLHLDVHTEALEHGLTLSDGSAYNIQFVGSRPVFLDSLAFVPYVESEPWAGYSQFCESFLNPLLLASLGSEVVSSIYRGRLRGVPVGETARQLGWWGALKAGVFMHVTVNAMAEAAADRRAGTGAARKPASTKAGLLLMLRSLRRAIGRLQLPGSAGWGDYESSNSYDAESRRAKNECVSRFVSEVKPGLLLDIGCNAGEYAETAIQAGARSVVGIERDAAALAQAVQRADRIGSFLPLQVDVQNPTPGQGWALGERTSLRERLRADAVICLALIHHLALGENAPLDVVLRDIVSYAPRGLIEFVPADDPMARRIAGPAARLRHPYDLPTFLAALSTVARVVAQHPLTATGRVLIEYRRS